MPRKKKRAVAVREAAECWLSYHTNIVSNRALPLKSSHMVIHNSCIVAFSSYFTWPPPFWQELLPLDSGALTLRIPFSHSTSSQLLPIVLRINPVPILDYQDMLVSWLDLSHYPWSLNTSHTSACRHLNHAPCLRAFLHAVWSFPLEVFLFLHLVCTYRPIAAQNSLHEGNIS